MWRCPRGQRSAAPRRHPSGRKRPTSGRIVRTVPAKIRAGSRAAHAHSVALLRVVSGAVSPVAGAPDRPDRRCDPAREGYDQPEVTLTHALPQAEIARPRVESGFLHMQESAYAPTGLPFLQLALLSHRRRRLHPAPSRLAPAARTPPGLGYMVRANPAPLRTPCRIGEPPGLERRRTDFGGPPRSARDLASPPRQPRRGPRPARILSLLRLAGHCPRTRSRRPHRIRTPGSSGAAARGPGRDPGILLRRGYPARGHAPRLGPVSHVATVRPTPAPASLLPAFLRTCGDASSPALAAAGPRQRSPPLFVPNASAR
jgi:hypothetical protein